MASGGRALRLAACLWLCLDSAGGAPAGGAPGNRTLPSACNRTAATVITLDAPKVTRTFNASVGQAVSWWAFSPSADDLSISVTPTNTSMDPDVRLAAVTGEGSCHVFATAQDYGGETLLLAASETAQLNATQYFLMVYCRFEGCAYHVAIINRRLRAEAPQELHLKQTVSGIAYHGVPLRFTYNCTSECAKAALEATNQRLTFSVWPRDATSAGHLALLVRKDKEPTSALDTHLKTTRGWFSGQVTSAPAAVGIWHVVVLKKSGSESLPFVLSVRLPDTIQQIPLGKPVFGALSKNQVAFFRFEVTKPDTDVEVYLTTLDGDPDLAMSHADVNTNPTPLAATWHSRKVGDDEILVPPSDPRRKSHPTGWFHVGVHGYRETAFSLIALAETHVDQDTSTSSSGSHIEVIDWTELWLGLPQSLSSQPGRTAHFLFYSRLATPRVFINMETLSGPSPDTCVVMCGLDPHLCPYISPYASNATPMSSGVSSCSTAVMRGARGDKQVAIEQPCSKCWYAILVSSVTDRSKFRILLGADGRAHPLVAGEAFQGHVDANDSSVFLVYDLSRAEAEERGSGSGLMRAIITPIYGDPVFLVREKYPNGTLLFASQETGQDDFRLQLSPDNSTRHAGLFYFEIKALTKHAQFRFQVSWAGSVPGPAEGISAGSNSSTAAEEGSLRGLGLPELRNGQLLQGALLRGRPDIYLYQPLGKGAPTFRFSAVPLGGTGCRLYAVSLPEDSAGAKAKLNELASKPDLAAQWRSEPGSEMLLIHGKDEHYLSPSANGAYAIAVASGAKAYVAINGDVACRADSLVYSWHGPGGKSELVCYQECERNSECKYFAHFPRHGNQDQKLKNRCDLYTTCASVERIPNKSTNVLFKVTKEAAWYQYEKLRDDAHCCADGGAAVGKVTWEADPSDCMPTCSARSDCSFFSHSVAARKCAFCSACNSSGVQLGWTSWRREGHGEQHPVEGSEQDKFIATVNNKRCTSHNAIDSFSTPNGKTVQECYSECAARAECAYFEHWPKGVREHADENIAHAEDNLCILYKEACEPYDTLQDPASRNTVYKLTRAREQLQDRVEACLLGNAWYTVAELSKMSIAGLRAALVQQLFKLPTGLLGLRARASPDKKMETLEKKSNLELTNLCPRVGAADHVGYQIEAGAYEEASEAKADNASGADLQELPTSGLPLLGIVDATEYRRYRVNVGTSDKNLMLSLVVTSGDGDLYVGVSPNVTRETSDLKSESVGSDSVLIPGSGALNRRHCGDVRRGTWRACAYFVAVRGSTRRTEFEISAHLASRVPQPLSPGMSLPLAIPMPSGGWQYFYVPVSFPMRPSLLQVTQQVGEVTSLSVKVIGLAQAKHPEFDLENLRTLVDFSGTKFAGVWRLELNESSLAELCRAARIGSGCAALICIHSAKGALGRAIHTVESISEQPVEQPVAAAQSEIVATALADGVPTRGTLRTSEDVLCFSFRVPETTADLSVSVTPLTSCAPTLQVEFPQVEGTSDFQKRNIRAVAADPRLHYISTSIPHSDSSFRAGVFYLWVRESGSVACEVDVRAQLVRTSVGAVDDFHPISILLDAPMYSSADDAKYFIFTSEIAEAADARKRDTLELTLTKLSGELQVGSAFVGTEEGPSKEERLMKAITELKYLQPTESSGASSLYVAGGFRERCGAALVCQLLVRVQSARPGRSADFMVSAADSSARAQTLIPGMPVRKCIGEPCPGKQGPKSNYQLVVNNPTADVSLRLTCEGQDRVKACQRLHLSADTRAPLPKLADRAYVSAQGGPGSLGGEIEVRVAQKSTGPAGACRSVPCVLFVQVQMSGDQGTAIEFELVATLEGRYALLLDGDEPMSVVAHPSHPEYFLFDTRLAHPSMMIVANVPYDSSDPHAELVSMYVLDCSRSNVAAWECHAYSEAEKRMDKGTLAAERGVCELDRADGFQYKLTQGHNQNYAGCQGDCRCCRRQVQRGIAEARSGSGYPSAENYRYRATANSRGQLVAQISRDNLGSLSEGEHCYFRIGFISHRLAPVTFTIRGFDSRQEVALPLGEPLEGAVSGRRPMSYELLGATALSSSITASTVVLSLEACAGKLRVETAPGRPGTKDSLGGGMSLTLQGSLAPTWLPLHENRWVRITAADQGSASYILAAEDPGSRLWLEPRPHRSLWLDAEDGSTAATLAWSPARLFGSGQPDGGAGGEEDHDQVAVYEVFLVRADSAEGNLSSPCGLYLEHRHRRARRIPTKTQRRLTVENLEPGIRYAFNVVARSVKTGHSIAYEPVQKMIHATAAAPLAASVPSDSSSGTFWGRAAPLIMIGTALALIWCIRPRCKFLEARRGWEMELPRMSARRYDHSTGGSIGGYFAASVVGMGSDATGYGQLS